MSDWIDGWERTEAVGGEQMVTHPGGLLKKPFLLVCEQVRSHVMEDSHIAKHIGYLESRRPY